MWEDLVTRIHTIHELHKNDPHWNTVKTSELVNETPQVVRSALRIYPHLPELKKATSFYGALDIVKAIEANAALKLLSNVDNAGTKLFPTKRSSKILHTSLIDWINNPTQVNFNFINCDFDEKLLRISTKLLENLPYFTAEYHNILLWLKPTEISDIQHIFGTEYSIYPTPLIWTYLPEKQRKIIPTREKPAFPIPSYKLALILSKNEVNFASSINDSYSTLTPSSKKPLNVLKHFFSLFTTPRTNFLDLNCTSNSIIAAEHLKCPRILGIQEDEKMYNEIKASVMHDRMIREKKDEV